jgi:serine protease Do
LAELAKPNGAARGTLRSVKNRSAISIAGMCMLPALFAACPKPRPAIVVAEKPSAKEIVKRSTPGIVRVEAGDDKVGTGFIVDKTGLVATNLHVIAGESSISVTLSDGSKLRVSNIAALDPDRDLALLTTVTTKDLPTLTLGDSDLLAAGDPILAIGNPLGVLDYSVSNGLVSSVRKVGPDLTVLQISAPISQGSSGGPLFNQLGEVVGITTAIITQGQNLNIAVPSNYLRPLLKNRKDPKSSMSLAEFAAATGGAPEGTTQRGPKITRQVPRHEISLISGCKKQDIAEVVAAIDQAIANGAPLYNQDNHEACFRIYEGTAIKYEQSSGCAGLRSAFGDGLLRVQTLSTPTEKAWAMRDTFDGILLVAQKWSTP